MLLVLTALKFDLFKKAICKIIFIKSENTKFQFINNFITLVAFYNTFLGLFSYKYVINTKTINI